MLTANLLDVHDIAYFNDPNPVALSRVTLRPWVISNEFVHSVFPRALNRTMDMLREEAPSHLHGFMIHSVQLGPKERYRPASVTTLRQYVSANPAIGCVTLRSLLGDRTLDRVVLVPTATHFPVQKWVWQHLAATLLYTAHVNGDNPDPL